MNIRGGQSKGYDMRNDMPIRELPPNKNRQLYTIIHYKITSKHHIQIAGKYKKYI